MNLNFHQSDHFSRKKSKKYSSLSKGPHVDTARYVYIAQYFYRTIVHASNVDLINDEGKMWFLSSEDIHLEGKFCIYDDNGLLP